MASFDEAVAKLAERGELELGDMGELTPNQKDAYAELQRREQAQADRQKVMASDRQEIMAELTGDIGPLQAFLIGTGKGFYNVGRGLGLADAPLEAETAGMEALKEERPYTTGAGEIVGEAAPFVPLGVAAGGIGAIVPRVAAGAAVGAAEGGIIAGGQDGDIAEGTATGAIIGGGAEILFPVLGRMGRKIFQRVRGTVPKGAMLDAAGRPTAELQGALDEVGLSFDDLVGDAQELISKQPPGAVPDQVARAAQFTEEGIPISKGELTRDFPQQFREQRLLESAQDPAAEPFRQFKLKQSEAIKGTLEKSMGVEVAQEETGTLIKDALSGRKKLLRTQKNELYRSVAEQSKELGGTPIFTDNIMEVVPDVSEFEDLAITAPQAMKSLDQILIKYGVKEPTEDMIEAGFTPTPLTLENFERFRKTLNAIERGDVTGAATVATRPIKEALDNELEEMASAVGESNLPENLLSSLKEARQRVRTIKTEFSPQSLVGRLVDIKKDGVTEILEASKIYNKLSAKSVPVEDIRKTVKSLNASGDAGKEALGALQTSTILDLLSAGFGTESRKISGVRVFNPIAFRKRAQTLGQDKLKAIFKGNKEALKKINNIEGIAKELTPENLAVPKGSSSSLLDLASTFISTKIPGGNMTLSALKSVVGPIKTGAGARKAVSATPEVLKLRSAIDEQFPGIASALGIAAIATTPQETTNDN